MPRRSRSQGIGTRGQNIFRTLLDDSWNINPIENDFGIDFIIERIDNGNLTGETVAVQVKTQDRLDFRHGRATVRGLKSDHLRYWLDHDLPVVIVVVDLSTRAGYLHPVQAATTNVNQSRKTFSISVRAENSVANTQDLMSTVDSLRASWRRRTMGDASQFAKDREAIYKAIDPRFDYSVKITRDGEAVSLLPCDEELPSITISGLGPSGVSKLNDAIARGVPQRFLSGELVIAGSPIFDRLSGKEILLDTRIEQDVDVSLAFCDRSGRVIGSTGWFQARSEGGRAEARIRFSVVPWWHVEITFAVVGAKADGNLKFVIEPPDNLEDLRSYRAEEGVLQLLGHSPYVHIASVCGQCRFSRGSMPLSVQLDSDGVAVLHQMRAAALCSAVARRLGTAVAVDAISRDDIEAAFYIYCACVRPMEWQPAAGTIDCILRPVGSGWRSKYAKPAGMRLRSAGLGVTFAGTEWKLMDFDIEYDRAKATQTRKVNNQEYRVKFAPVADGRMRMNCADLASVAS